MANALVSEHTSADARRAARSTISVALCTLNGALYLREQLASIFAQTRRPDEIVVCDDNSGDGSLQLASDMLRESGIVHRLVENATRLGVRGNFEQAIRLCEHEIVAFSDQDDVWYPDKLARLEAELLRSPAAVAVFSDARAVDVVGKPLGFSQWEACFFEPNVRAAFRRDLFPLLVRYPVVCGATFAVRRAFALRCLPIGDGWIHDEWISILCAAMARVRFVDAELVDHRLHAGQAIGLLAPTLRARFSKSKALNASYFEEQIRRFRVLEERLQRWTPRPPSAVLDRVAQKLAFLEGRFQIRAGRVNPWVMATSQLVTGSHHRFAQGFKSWLADVGYDMVHTHTSGNPDASRAGRHDKEQPRGMM
jgi:glycosyltransferase involved in cell wall biosynthesis